MDQSTLESPQTVTKLGVKVGESFWGINESKIGVGEKKKVWEWLKMNNKCTRRTKMF